ncbi:MAG: hypothetical protein KF895_14515 [Parvibaculum sp.]|nr:hypothetical protein [Parvibaculum sp.]
MRKALRSMIAGTTLIALWAAPALAESAKVPAPGGAPGGLRVSSDVSTIRVQNYVKANKDKQTPANSNTESTPVNGIGGTGGGRLNLEDSEASEAAAGSDFVNVESSNRDHIDQDAQTDIKK